MNLFKMVKAAFTSAPRCTPSECSNRVRNGEAFLVDVREPGEWAGGVAQSATLLAFSDLTGARAQWTPFLAKVGSREILLYCASGARSGMAARLLVAEGVRAANTGSLADWRGAGWPVSVPPRRR
jgi:sulfur-carrier protein adenylyltransferase/sulfurtransferase